MKYIFLNHIGELNCLDQTLDFDLFMFHFRHHVTTKSRSDQFADEKSFDQTSVKAMIN